MSATPQQFHPRRSAPAAPQTDVEALKRQVDPVQYIGQHVPLRKEGRDHVGLCPFHEERTPSFKVNQLGFKCFGGDVIRFTQEFEGISFPQAVSRVKEFVNAAPEPSETPRKPPVPARPTLGKIVAVYDYTHEDGTLEFQAVRYKPKDFRQRRPHPTQRGKWIWSINGGTYDGVELAPVRPVLFNLPKLAQTDQVLIFEGEKDCLTAERFGYTGTTNAAGAKKFTAEHAEQLRGKHVVAFGDNDGPGREHVELVAQLCDGIAAVVRIGQIPEPFKDFTEWVEGGATRSDIQRAIQEAKLFQAPRPSAEDKTAAAENSPASQSRGKRSGSGDGGGDWRAGLIRTDKGQVKALLANALLALRSAPEWTDAIYHDEFALATVIAKPLPWGRKVGDRWTPHDDALLSEWMQHAGIHVGPDIVGQAVETVAREHKRHPVRDWLDSLEWDGESRLARLFSHYFGAVHTRYIEAIGPRWAISAVARIHQPGAQVDHTPVLEGGQGIGKSSGCGILGGEWYTDELSEPGTKDAAMQLAGAWIVELSELDSLSRAEATRIKAFMSRRTDRYRPPYSSRIMESPRQSVFIATTNLNAYLRDETGARRFWPVRCGKVNLDALKEDRSQIWAEAVARYKAGEPWWLDSRELQREAADEQEGRYQGDPWDEAVSKFLDASERVTIQDVLEGCFPEHPKERWSQADANRVARILQAQKWERKQVRDGQKRSWFYFPPDDQS